MRKLGIALGGAIALAFAATPQAYAKKCTNGETSRVASYKIEEGKSLDYAVNQSLTGKKGDPKKGLEAMVNRKQGNCIACHKVSAIQKLAKPGDVKSMAKYGFQGDVGPELDGVASRYTEGELRMIVINVRKIFPDTVMPAFHVNKGFVRPIKNCEGKAIFSPERVEDVVAYLMTLK